MYGVNQSVSNHPEIAEVFKELKKSLPPETLTDEPHIIDYPAPTWIDFHPRNLDPWHLAAFAALLKGQQFLGYRALNNHLSGVFRECPQQQVVLAGHSLGAWVIDDWLQTNRPNPDEGPGEVVAVVLTGDPQFRQKATGGKGRHRPRPTLGIAARIPGLGSVDPYPVEGWAGRLKTWCLPGDPICGKNYVSLIAQAAAASVCQTTDCPHMKYGDHVTQEEASFLRNMILNGPGE